MTKRAHRLSMSLARPEIDPKTFHNDTSTPELARQFASIAAVKRSLLCYFVASSLPRCLRDLGNLQNAHVSSGFPLGLCMANPRRILCDRCRAGIACMPSERYDTWSILIACPALMHLVSCHLCTLSTRTLSRHLGGVW